MEKQLTFPKTFLVNRIPTFCAENKRSLCHVMHVVITNRTTVLYIWHPLVAALRRLFNNFTSRTGISFTNTRISGGVRCKRRIAKDLFKFTSQKCSKNIKNIS